MRNPKEAAIAQLDRVQVSEACGVGSSPAERTIFLLHTFRSYLKYIKKYNFKLYFSFILSKFISVLPIFIYYSILKSTKST